MNVAKEMIDTHEKRAAVIADFYKKGYTFGQIARFVNISREAVAGTVNRLQNKGKLPRRRSVKETHLAG